MNVLNAQLQDIQEGVTLIKEELEKREVMLSLERQQLEASML